jgi:hypothetical protein
MSQRNRALWLIRCSARAAPPNSWSPASRCLLFKGGLDPYGRPDQFPDLPPTTGLVEIPRDGHLFNNPVRVAETVVSWLDRLAVSIPQD